MDTYVILRRSGWASRDELGEAAARSKKVGDEEMSDVRWIRSYVLGEPGAPGHGLHLSGLQPEAIASRAGLPADEIIPVADTVIVRPDPEPAAA